MEGFAVLLGLVYVGVIIFFITLTIRFVKAVEKMSNSVEKFADKFESR